MSRELIGSLQYRNVIVIANAESFSRECRDNAESISRTIYNRKTPVLHWEHRGAYNKPPWVPLEGERWN